jgi:agmatine/peptidylarginine deiminase
VSRVERVEILCLNEELENDLTQRLERQEISGDIRVHRASYNRAWLRDSGPVGVVGEHPHWLSFTFTGWGHLPEVELDRLVPQFVSSATSVPLIEAHEDNSMNFYFANGIVLVPTYNDLRNRQALGLLADLLPNHCEG